MTPFEELLAALGKVFHLSLHVDKSHACSIQLQGCIIQLQLDITQENLWIFSKITEIPPGKFRENILREALKANSLPDPRIAVFGYLASTAELALFQKYPLVILNGERLAGLIGAFTELATSWRQAIATGSAAPPTTSRGANPFGLK